MTEIIKDNDVVLTFPLYRASESQCGKYIDPYGWVDEYQWAEDRLGTFVALVTKKCERCGEVSPLFCPGAKSSDIKEQVWSFCHYGGCRYFTYSTVPVWFDWTPELLADISAYHFKQLGGNSLPTVPVELEPFFLNTPKYATGNQWT